MALGPDSRTFGQARTEASVGFVDEGLRQYMLRVYNYMTTGLGLSGLTAWAVANVPALQSIFFNELARPTILGWIAIIAPLALVFFLSARISSMSVRSAQLTFVGYAALTGIGLSTILMAYTGASIARVFFITAGTFAAMSVYGYTTKRDLTKLGSFLFMGLIGLIIAMVVNLFVQSGMFALVISVIGVFIFVGLTAYDTQAIRQIYDEVSEGDDRERAAIFGGLRLYLDFLNLFVMLIHLLGVRRD